MAEAGGLVYDYAGEATYGRLLAGVVGVKWVVPPERREAFYRPLRGRLRAA